MSTFITFICIAYIEVALFVITEIESSDHIEKDIARTDLSSYDW